MAAVMDCNDVTAPDAVLDLVNGTWTCVEHGTVMPLDGTADCADCQESVNAPPHVPDWLIDNIVG